MSRSLSSENTTSVTKRTRRKSHHSRDKKRYRKDERRSSKFPISDNRRSDARQSDNDKKTKKFDRNDRHLRRKSRGRGASSTEDEHSPRSSSIPPIPTPLPSPPPYEPPSTARHTDRGDVSPHGGTRGKQKRHLRRRFRASGSRSNSSVDSDTLITGQRGSNHKPSTARARTETELNKLVEDEVNRRVEAEVQRRFEQIVSSAPFQREIQERLNLEKDRLESSMRHEIELEKTKIMDDFKRQEIEKKQKSQQLEDILVENERKIKEEQQRLAKEHAKANEERLLELQRRQHEQEEARRKKQQEAQQEKAAGGAARAKKPKIAFKLAPNKAF